MRYVRTIFMTRNFQLTYQRKSFFKDLTEDGEMNRDMWKLRKSRLCSVLVNVSILVRIEVWRRQE